MKRPSYQLSFTGRFSSRPVTALLLLALISLPLRQALTAETCAAHCSSLRAEAAAHSCCEGASLSATSGGERCLSTHSHMVRPSSTLLPRSGLPGMADLYTSATYARSLTPANYTGESKPGALTYHPFHPLYLETNALLI